VRWDEFYALIHDRFDHDQHESLIRQLFHIHQEGTVSEYVKQFSELVDQLASYESNPNPLYYAMRFVDGLGDDIKAMAMIHRPSTLNSANALALVQKEALDNGKKKEYIRYEPFTNRQVHRSAYPLLVPPKLDKPLPSTRSDDKIATEAAQANTSDEKMRAL
jgi:hypothetical protein